VDETPNPVDDVDAPTEGRESRTLADFWRQLVRRGHYAPVMRLAGHVGLLLVIALGIWAARAGANRLPDAAPAVITAPPSAAGGPEVMSQAPIGLEDLPVLDTSTVGFRGVARLAMMDTIIPTRPRTDVIKYVVQKGDSLFGIAERFGLKPETILWGNWYELEGDPHTLSPGQELNILPIDGVLHVWSAGEGLNGVAKFYGVSAKDILDWPGNGLNPGMDPANPQIEEGMALVVPGGKREAPTWRSPRITRANPGVAKILGPGACGSVYDGPVGTGSFAWPTSSTWISGYTYDPSVHPAIDLGGSVGNGIFASDNGVVVYAGWNDWGYGYVIVLDHGNGWQTLYAHLSAVNVGCGQGVFQGNVIGGMGCTGNCSGPHLHFEMMSDQYGKVNPLNFLP
jgi:murein DD-endopeptidase MepM/ murein hydrolase activator NlpD